MESVFVGECWIIFFECCLAKPIHKTSVNLREIGSIVASNKSSEILEAISLSDEFSVVRVKFFFMDLEGADHNFIEGFFQIVDPVAS